MSDEQLDRLHNAAAHTATNRQPLHNAADIVTYLHRRASEMKEPGARQALCVVAHEIGIGLYRDDFPAGHGETEV